MPKKFCLIAVAVVLSLCLMAPAAMAETKFLRMFSGPEGVPGIPWGRP